MVQTGQTSSMFTYWECKINLKEPKYWHFTTIFSVKPSDWVFFQIWIGFEAARAQGRFGFAPVFRRWRVQGKIESTQLKSKYRNSNQTRSGLKIKWVDKIYLKLVRVVIIHELYYVLCQLYICFLNATAKKHCITKGRFNGLDCEHHGGLNVKLPRPYVCLLSFG